MDHYFRVDIRLFLNTDDGTKYVSDRGKIKTTHGKVLWNQMGGDLWISGPIVLYFRGIHVFSEKNCRETGVAWKTEAAKIKSALSCLHSWFYSAQGGGPPGTLTGQAR